MEGRGRLLIVDDEPEIIELLEWNLRKRSFYTRSAPSAKDALHIIASEEMDILITDIRMPCMDGIELIGRAMKLQPDLQCIVVTGHGEMESAVEAMKLGAVNYLRKPIGIEALDVAITKSMEKLALIREVRSRRESLERSNARLHKEIGRRKRAVEIIRNTARKYRALMDNAGDAIMIFDTNGYIVEANRKALELSGYSLKELQGKHFTIIVPQEKRQEALGNVAYLISQGTMVVNDVPIARKDGAVVSVDITGGRVEFTGTQVVQIFMRDITLRKKFEEEVQKSARLETIGVLAGGIAHDFNNILTSLSNMNALARKGVDTQSSVFQKLLDMDKVIQTAKGLSLQLLTFAKGGDPVKKSASVATLLSHTVLFALSGSSLKCEFHLTEDLWPVLIDEGQVAQAVHNLIINAVQASKEGGQIEVAAVNVSILDEPGLPLSQGQYVKISITDHGEGIPPDVIQKIFDPFFTTKSTGSGLGLSVSYSILKKHDGYLDVTSKSGKGATFILYLPACVTMPPVIDCSTGRQEIPPATGKHRVLFMDDDEVILEATGALLADFGYEVGLAEKGERAIELFKEAQSSGKPFQVAILDLTVRGGMGGKKAVTELLALDPGIKTIVASGYSNDPVMADPAAYGFHAVLSKPYDFEELRELLEQLIAR